MPRLLLALLLCAGSAAAQDTQQPDLNHLSLEDLMQVKVETVSGASKFIQRVADAPASVTIITGEEIQRYGYRTLADVLRSVRGFYVINDRNYSYVGVRGFSQPEDYNARILFLLDGHRINDNIFDGAYVGTEFPVDVDLIDRVEIIRGAGSTVYGTGAFIAVVNVVTKRGRDLDSVEFSSDGGSLNSYKGRASYGDRFNNGLEMLVSGTFYNSQGHPRLFFPEFDSPATHNGVAVNADGDRSYNLFADFIYRDFNIHAVQASRTKHIPTASFGTVFNDPRNQPPMPATTLTCSTTIFSGRSGRSSAELPTIGTVIMACIFMTIRARVSRPLPRTLTWQTEPGWIISWMPLADFSNGTA